MNNNQIIALVIFVITYIGIIFGRLPKIKVDRKSVAFIGSVLMIVFGIISFEDAIKSIDFNTIALLLGMMVIISDLQLEGFFSLISQKTLTMAKNSSHLLTLIVFITGFASAFLVNDAVVLLFTPVIIDICKKSSLNPIPFLLGEIFSSNAGSLMSLTGNPQNMIIGIASDISFAKFLVLMLPLAVVSMIIIIYIIKKTNRDMFVGNDNKQITDCISQNRSWKEMHGILIVFVLTIIGFFLAKIISLPIPIVALVAAAMTFVVSKHESKDIVKHIDFSLLLFFASLFIIVAAVKQSGVMDAVFNISLHQNAFSILIVFTLSLVMSQLVSNVPYVILVLPIFTLANSEILWLSLASSSTLAGNMTIIGAMANLIVIEQAEKQGIILSARKFYRPAITITILTCLLAIAYFVLLGNIQY